jgi:beta-lactamase class D
MRQAHLVALALVTSAVPHCAHAGTSCTIVTKTADSRVLLEQGDCRNRVTPASTFEIACAVMGFDLSFLTDPRALVLSYKAGAPDQGGEAAAGRPNTLAEGLRRPVVAARRPGVE